MVSDGTQCFSCVLLAHKISAEVLRQGENCVILVEQIAMQEIQSAPKSKVFVVVLKAKVLCQAGSIIGAPVPMLSADEAPQQLAELQKSGVTGGQQLAEANAGDGGAAGTTGHAESMEAPDSHGTLGQLLLPCSAPLPHLPRLFSCSNLGYFTLAHQHTTIHHVR